MPVYDPQFTVVDLETGDGFVLGQDGLGQDDFVTPHDPVDDLTARAVDSRRRHQNVAVQDDPHVLR